MIIPKQLTNDKYRFVKLKKNDKIPFEKDWQNTANYIHNDPNIMDHNGNVGIVSGYGNLRILDADDKQFGDEMLKTLPKTLTVRTGSGGLHFYLISDYDVNHTLVDDLGEYRAKNTQVVLPGCRHPNGNFYKISRDIDITTVPRDQMVDILKPYIRNNAAPGENKTPVKRDSTRSAREYREVCRLIGKGMTKEEVFKEMMAFVKWSGESDHYRQVTYRKASNYIESQQNVEQHKEISDESLLILSDKNLLDNIDKEFEKKIVGERDIRKSIFLCCCGKYVLNHSIASFNLCNNSNSGAGKDYVAKNVIKIFPSDDVHIRSRITPSAFTYWHNSKFEPAWTWDGKILLLSDISNNVLNSEVFKLMCSDGTHSTVVINQQAIDIEIKGKPVMIITTASANPNNEMLRRFPLQELDESIDQTKEIKKRQAETAIEGSTLDYDKRYTDALRFLKSVKVKIPFAKELIKATPDGHIIMRTHFHRLLDYIKASAALHQYQRGTDPDGYTIAEPSDYDNAAIVLKTTTSNPMMIPLTKKQKMLLAECKKLTRFCYKEIESHIPFYVQSKIYEALGKLQELGFLDSETEDREGSKKPIRYYIYKPFEIKHIPTWSELTSKCRKKGNKGEKRNQGNMGNEGNNVKN